MTECPLWSRVLAAVCPPGQTLEEHARQVVAWQRSCRTRHTRRVLRATPRPPDGWPATLAASYRAIAAQTGASVIVDSSKFASDAALLGRFADITPAYVHLVRDPRGAAHSWLGPNHTVTGNPNRFDRGRIQLGEDRRWQHSMPRRQRAMATVVTLPLLRRYQYSRRP